MCPELVTVFTLFFVCWSQVVQSGGKNIELAVIRRNQPLKVINKANVIFSTSSLKC